jgi:hypothetical protein
MLNIIQNTIGALARKGLSVIRNGLKMWLPFEKSEILGEDVVTDGNFPSGTSAWLVTDGTVTFNNEATFDVNSKIRQNLFDIGTVYKVTYEVTENVGNMTLRFYDGNTYNYVADSVDIHTVYLTATSTTYFYISTLSGTSLTLKNISVKEVTQIAPDKSGVDKEILGVEEVQDGTFEYDFDYWSAGSDWSVVDNIATLSLSDSATNSTLTSDGTLTTSKTYLLTYTISNWSQGELALVGGNISLPSTNGNKAVYITNQTSLSVKRYGGAGAAALSISNISVKEVTQAYAEPNSAKLFTGKALSFDGVNDYVDVGSHIIGTNDFTVALTFKNTTTSAINGLISSEAASYSNRFYYIINTDGTLGIYIKIDGVNIIEGQVSTDDYSTGVHRLVGVADRSGNFSTYVDGVLIGTTDISGNQGNWNTDKNWTLGARNEGTTTFGNVNMSDLQIYDTAWTQADVTFDYNNPQHLVTDNSELRYGSDLGTNMDFSGGESPWALNSNWSLGGVGVIADGTSDSTVWQNSVVQDNKFYKVTYTLTDFTQGTVNVELGGTNGISRTIAGTYTEILQAGTSPTTRITFEGSGSFKATLSNISVKEVVSPTLSNLKGYWHLSEGDGAINYDSSGEGNDGTIIGATWEDQQATIPQLGLMDWAKSTPVADEITLIADPNDPSKDILGNSVRLREHSLNLDGSGYAEVPDADNLDFGTGDFSIEAWVKFQYTNQGGSVYNCIYTHGGDVQSVDGFGLVTVSNGRVRLKVGGTSLESTSTFSEGEWVHIIGTRIQGTDGVKLYINGNTTPDDTATNNNSVTNSLVKQIGKDPSSAYRDYNNLIDDVRIYNRALSSDEVEQNYKAGLNKHKASSSFSDDFSSDYGF